MVGGIHIVPFVIELLHLFAWTNMADQSLETLALYKIDWFNSTVRVGNFLLKEILILLLQPPKATMSFFVFVRASAGSKQEGTHVRLTVDKVT